MQIQFQMTHITNIDTADTIRLSCGEASQDDEDYDYDIDLTSPLLHQLRVPASCTHAVRDIKEQ